MDRRRFLLTSLAGSLAAPRAVEAQPARSGTSPVHVGVLHYGNVSVPGVLRAFHSRLAEHGYVTDRNLVIDLRYADGRREKVPGYLAELLSLGARVIIAVGPYVLRIVNNLETTVPIVAIDLESDPVAAGFAKSLARPGGNVTGTFLDQADLVGKWLQLLRQINPRLSRVAVIWDSSTPSYQLEAFKTSARSIAVEFETIAIGRGEDFTGAFVAAARARAEAAVILSSPLVSSYGDILASLSVAEHLPTVSMFRENVTAGCLMAYGPSVVDGWARLGSFAGRILNGAKVPDLPIERPTTFELAINLRTATSLGLTIPPSLLAQADQVIQ